MSESEPKKPRLFVLGESSPDSKDWFAAYKAFAIAHDEKQALALHDAFNVATEIPVESKYSAQLQLPRRTGGLRHFGHPPVQPLDSPPSKPEAMLVPTAASGSP